ncbi:HupE/UreJ family protein [Glaciecola sp. 2405UD65-10]|uniref:HupE/UreJ family protein n=1 Tax=Glaciecola sp. 2405UD65-10 TaxID=3397244 RepID=UPI003B59B680
MKYLTLLSLLFISFQCIQQASAHELSTSYVNANIEGDGRINGKLKIDVIELKEVLNLDSDNNGQLTWGEITEQKARIKNYVENNFSFSQNALQCPLQISQDAFSLQQLSDSYLLHIPFSAECSNESQAGALAIKYSLLFEISDKHKAIVSILDTQNTHEYLVVFDKSTQEHSISSYSSNTLTTFLTFVYQGIFHILIGIDHILFLLTLLLTISLYYTHKRWQAIDSKADIVKRTIWVVSAFTIAHSITLSGTALGWLPVFGSWVEVVIAASILFNVVNNLFPMVRRLGLITFIFGLIHGMGFAGALAELGFPEQQQVVSVLAFNIGVELGQLAIIAICLPLLLWLRKKAFYAKILMPSISLIIGLVALFWVFERI